MSHKAEHLIGRHLPDPEKSQNMVDAVCVEIFRHLGEPFLPPAVAIFSHPCPIIGREAPVLAFY